MARRAARCRLPRWMRCLLPAVLAAGALSSVPAFDWPVQDPIVTSTFAENRGDHLLPGIELGGRRAVYAVAEGEIVFYYRDERGYSSFPRGTGSTIVLQHEGRIRSVYAHLETETMELGETVVQSGRSGGPLAYTGDSGAAMGHELLFLLIDLEESEFLNPIMYDEPLLYPPLGDDRRGPVIGRMYLKRGSSMVELSDGMSVPAGDVELLAEIYDGSTYVSFLRRMAPYRLYSAKNGQAVLNVCLDSLREQDGRLVVPAGSLGLVDLYADTWLYRIGRTNLVEGRTRLQVKAESHSGAERQLILDLTVTSE